MPRRRHQTPESAPIEQVDPAAPESWPFLACLTISCGLAATSVRLAARAHRTTQPWTVSRRAAVPVIGVATLTLIPLALLLLVWIAAGLGAIS
jgi:hypothetical protein